MHVRLVSILTCFGVMALAHSQGLFPVHSKDPMKYVKSFSEQLARQGLQDRDLLEQIGSKDELINAFRNLPVNDSLNGVISDCAVAYVTFWKDVVMRKKYAIQMIDSWGKLGSGIERGNLQWMGRYYECTNSHTNKFSGKYFYVMYNLAPAQSFIDLENPSGAIGLCLPSSCSSKQVQKLVSPVFKLIKKPIFVYSPEQPTQYTTADIIALVVTSFLGCLMIVGTVYELYLNNKERSVAAYTQLGSYPEIPIEKPTSAFSNLVLSFSFIKNTKAVFDTTQKEGNINVLHGLRFFSMTWVILGHSFIFGANYIDNGLDAADVYVSKWSFQAIGNATFSVDSFFFLSGLLAAYLGLKELKKRGGKINVPLMFIYRYLRLTPAYAFCILITASLYGKFGNGPYWPQTAEAFGKPCRSYWWTNLLYINNMYPITIDKECFAWGWYLANDMQFFLVLPLLLLLMYKRPLIGAAVLNVGVMLSMLAAGVISSHYKQQPQPLAIGLSFHMAIDKFAGTGDSLSIPEGANLTTIPYPTNFTTAIPVTTPAPTPPSGPSNSVKFWSDIYTKPWCRFGSYFVGILAGLIMYSANTKVRMSKMLAALGWAVAVATAMALIYGLYTNIRDGEAISVHLAAFYNAVSRPLWTYCLLWLVVACAGGYGGPINTFLSWKAFIPLSRLTYCAYLVHPLVIFWVYGIIETKIHFSLAMIAVLYAGIVPISYSIAFVVSMLIEMPMLGITKALFGKRMEVKPQQPINVVPDPKELHDHPNGNI